MSTQSLQTQLTDYINAAFSGIWIHSDEHDDAIQEIARMCAVQGWTWMTWDIDRGLQMMGSPTGDANPDPLAAIKALNGMRDIDGKKATILVIRNLHLYLKDGMPDIIQAVDTTMAEGKVFRTFLVGLSPVVQIPLEVRKKFVVVEHNLPDKEEMGKILKNITAEPNDIAPGVKMDYLLESLGGLTRFEAENALSLSLVRYGKIRPDVVWEIKAATLKKEGTLELYRGKETFKDLGGLDNLKNFTLKALTSHSKKAKARGVMLLGVPGSGKSALAKALGNEVGRPTVIMDVGSLMGSLVGETEENTRRALKQVDAMSPCILYVDELDKSLSGVQGSGANDSGVSARMFGSLLTWLNDHETDVFFVATLNDISKLPPEFSRAERFDGIFFVDLPSNDQKRVIWEIYENMYEVNHTDKNRAKQRPSDKDWTGAEIKSCCRLASLLGISLMDSAQNIVPVAITAGERMESLRSWAAGRCLHADKPGLYTRDNAPMTTTESKPTRTIRRPSASDN